MQTRHNCGSRNLIIGQNAAHALWFKVRIPCLPINREHSEGSPPETNTACIDVIGVHCNGHYNRTPDLGKCEMWWNTWDLARHTILDTKVLDCYDRTTSLTQTRRTASFISPFYSLHRSPCTIRSGDFFCSVLYDINLGATHTTILSTRGVQIPIYLASSATDSF